MRQTDARGVAWFGEAPRPRDRRGWLRLVTGAFVIGLAAAAYARFGPTHLPLATDLAVFAGTFALSLLLTSGLWAWHVWRTRRGLVLRAGTLYFTPGQGQPEARLLDLREPFGVTTLANRARSRASLAITTATASFYVSGQFDEHSRIASHGALKTAFTVASDERALEAAAPDGLPLELDGDTFGRFFGALLALDPRCTSRLFLSGHRGDAVIVDDRALTVGERLFDLTSALEWHGALFREQAFGAMSVFQLTHVRQGEQEVAFVSLMPALAAPSCPGDVVATSEPELERAVLRDMGLLNVGVEEPPPPHLRVAIERVFMLPLRAALDAAPTARPSSGASVSHRVS